MSWCIGASQSDGMDIGASGVFISDYYISGDCSAEASMAGSATVNLILIEGDCSAEASMYGLAVSAESKFIVGSCSAEGVMTGFAFSNVLPVIGSCSAEASMTGIAFTDLFIIGSCSAEASMTGLATAFSYIIGEMSATAIMLGDLGFLPVLVRPRRADYDPDKFWDEETKTWLDSRPLEKLAGGRHQNVLVVVSDQNLIYVGGI